MPRIIDLSLPLEEGMRGVSFETSHVLEKDGWNARFLHLYSHAGTHVDAPIHYGIGGGSVAGIPLDQCMGPAWIADCTTLPQRALIGPEDLGPIREWVQQRESLLIKTGWSAFVGRPEYRDALPRISKELAEWCAERELSMIGVETPAVADVHNREELQRIHRTLLEAGIVIIEGLANLEALTKDRVTLIAFPLKITGGDGSPVRAVAIEDL